MTKILALVLIFTIGCGTILNSGTATIMPPPGATVDGVAGPIPASQQQPHEVIYPDGRRCIVEPKVSGLYIVGDIFLFFLVGIIVDAVTGNWKVLDAGSCPGVIVN